VNTELAKDITILLRIVDKPVVALDHLQFDPDESEPVKEPGNPTRVDSLSLREARVLRRSRKQAKTTFRVFLRKSFTRRLKHPSFGV
jgi:hypothetical protein